MKGQLLKAFAYYREHYTEQVFVFHQSDEYLICSENMQLSKDIAKLHSTSLLEEQGFCAVIVTSNKINVCLQDLYNKGISLRSIEYKNDNKESIIPNIDLIIKEQELDY